MITAVAESNVIGTRSNAYLLHQHSLAHKGLYERQGQHIKAVDADGRW